MRLWFKNMIPHVAFTSVEYKSLSETHFGESPHSVLSHLILLNYVVNSSEIKLLRSVKHASFS
jgi:hypothetical protein